MPLPSLSQRLAGFRTDISQLNSWSAMLPSTRIWVERLNELRLVRATLAWEDFLEETFLCYLRGSGSVTGKTYALSVAPAHNLADAMALALGTAPYGKWLNEKWTGKRADALFAGVHPYAVLTTPVFPEIRTVRNRIVHRSSASQAEFRSVVRGSYGVLKPGLTPGRFLSDGSAGVPRIEHYLSQLTSAATIVAT